MGLAARWRKVHGDIDFVMLAKNPIDATGGRCSRGVVMTGFDFSDKTVWVTGGGDRLRDGAGVCRRRGAGDRLRSRIYARREYPCYRSHGCSGCRTGCAGVLGVCCKKRRGWMCWSTPPVFCVWGDRALSVGDWQQTFAVNVGGILTCFSQTMAAVSPSAGEGDCHRSLQMRRIRRVSV